MQEIRIHLPYRPEQAGGVKKQAFFTRPKGLIAIQSPMRYTYIYFVNNIFKLDERYICIK